MFDDDEEPMGTIGTDSDDDFDYYVSYIKALEEEAVSKADIVRELMDEFDLEQEEAIKVLRRYLSNRDSFDDEDEEEDDIVPDDDYGDGNSEN